MSHRNASASPVHAKADTDAHRRGEGQTQASVTACRHAKVANWGEQRGCVRAHTCVRACVRACVCVCVRVFQQACV